MNYVIGENSQLRNKKFNNSHFILIWNLPDLSVINLWRVAIIFHKQRLILPEL
jgi:hypothetical protein